MFHTDSVESESRFPASCVFVWWYLVYIRELIHDNMLPCILRFLVLCFLLLMNLESFFSLFSCVLFFFLWLYPNVLFVLLYRFQMLYRLERTNAGKNRLHGYVPASKRLLAGGGILRQRLSRAAHQGASWSSVIFRVHPSFLPQSGKVVVVISEQFWSLYLGNF